MQAQKADVLIAPHLSAYNRADSEPVRDLIREGYTAGKRMITKELHMKE